MRLSALTAAIVISTLSISAHANEELLKTGKKVFTQQCARCHGSEGKGDGPDANKLLVPPRDITSGIFKWKTTKQGTQPSDKDIKTGIISHGLAGSGMPSFSNLSETTKEALVAYIKSISPAFVNGVPPEPIPDPKNIKAKPDLVKGKEVYETLQCALCHGAGGRANGSSAFSLTDQWKHPIKPANLTQPWTYRGGSDTIDIYHRMLSGIEGAPMPSYEGAVTNEEAWLLSAYVESMQLEPNFSKDLYAAKAKGSLPTTADDKAWNDAKRTDVNLDNFYYENGKRFHFGVNAISVQAIYDDASVAFKLSWDDPTQSKTSSSRPDAALLALLPEDYHGDPRGNLLNLYAPAAPALHLNYWSAASDGSLMSRTSNIDKAASNKWKGESSSAAANYNDGQYTLVFQLKRPNQDESRIGFAVWDGDNNESGLKYAGSEWIWLNLGDKPSHH